MILSRLLLLLEKDYECRLRNVTSSKDPPKSSDGWSFHL